MSILDFPRLDLGAVLRPLGQDDDILGRWRMRHGLDTCFLVGFSTVPGSERPRYTQGRIIGPCDQSESVRVTIMLRRKNAREFERLVREFERRQTSDPIKPLSSEEFARRFGADSADIQTVAAFAAQAGLQVEETDIGRRIVVLSGTVRNMNKAFGVQLQNCEEGGRSASGARLTSA